MSLYQLVLFLLLVLLVLVTDTSAGDGCGTSKGNSRTSKLRESKIMEPLEDPLPLGLSLCSTKTFISNIIYFTT
ncbi:hypothetical protein M0804_010285 [Polistes exclamans]|nr:hypothetical protein M0804_010285 [Polistes exclamans]